METLSKEKTNLAATTEETHLETDNNTVSYQPGDSCSANQEGNEHVDPNDWDRKILKCTNTGSGYVWKDTGRRRSG